MLRLADGSSIELGSDSALSVALGNRQRVVTLYKGEAFFTVAADAGRPFVVQAAGGSAQALGTAFNIKTVEGMAIVTVTGTSSEERRGGKAGVSTCRSRCVADN